MEQKIKAIVALVFSAILLITSVWFTILNATTENIVGIVFGTIATLTSIWCVWNIYKRTRK